MSLYSPKRKKLFFTFSFHQMICQLIYEIFFLLLFYIFRRHVLLNYDIFTVEIRDVCCIFPDYITGLSLGLEIINYHSSRKKVKHFSRVVRSALAS